MATGFLSANAPYSTSVWWTTSGGSSLINGTGNLLSTDTADLNAHTLTLDTNITVAQIQNTGTGGVCNVSTTRTITANIFAGTTSCIVWSGAGGTTLTVTGNITGGGANGVGINTSTAGAINVTGNLQGGSSSSGIGSHAITSSGAATITINGTVIGGTSGSGGDAISNTSTGSLIIVGNVTGGASGTTSGINSSSTATVSVTGSITGGGANGAVGVICAGALTVNTGPVTGAIGVALSLSGSGTHTINCNVGASTSTGSCIVYTGTGAVNITGNLVGPTTNSASPCMTTTSTGVVTIVGNITGGTQANSAGSGLSSSGSGAINVTGTVSGGNQAGIGNNEGIKSTSNATITVTGNVVGGFTSTANNNAGIALTNVSFGICNISGTVTGSTNGGSSSSVGIYNLGSATVNVTGNSVAGTGGSGALGAASSTTIVGGVTFSSGATAGIDPIGNYVKLVHAGTTQTAIVPKSGGGTLTLVNSGSNTGQPVIGDVRLGTVYALGSLTGTLAVPNPNQVSFGVATDNTTGNAVLTPALVLSSLTTGAGSGTTKINVDASGYLILQPSGLDSITATDPGAVASTFPQMGIQLWRRFFKKSTLTATTLSTYKDDNTTVETAQTISDDGTTQTQSSA